MCPNNKNTTTQTSAPNPQAMSAYEALLSQAGAVGATPYTPFVGQGVAPVNTQQYTGVGNINDYALSGVPAAQWATGVAENAAQPISASDINQYVNPWTQNVVGSTEAQFANQNAQQLAAVKGNAIAQGALGGNREAIAEAETTNQQQLAQAPVIAGLESQGYTQGVNTALTEQQAKLAGAYGATSAGVAGENAALSGANAQVGAGSLEQQTQQAQDTYDYQQYLAQMGFPFQETQWLAGLDTGVGSQMGGTSTTTTPPPSLASQIGGLGLGALGLFGSGGLAALASGGGVANRLHTITETHETLLAQQHQLVSGHRRVQMFPEGTKELPLPHGMARIRVPAGIFHYDPKRINAAQIRHLSARGHENELLDLGPFSKHEIMRRLAGGEIPLTVVERHPDGTEVRAAAGTHVTAHHQIAEMERTKSPGHTVGIEHPHVTIGARLRWGGGAVNGVAGFDSGGGVAGMPYVGGPSFIPGMSITHGPGAPRPPNPPQQNAGQQANQLGALGKIFKGGNNGTAADAAQDAAQDAEDDAADASSPLDVGGGGISDAAIWWRGGGVRGYADGGGPTDDDLDVSDLPNFASSGVAPLNDDYGTIFVPPQQAPPTAPPQPIASDMPNFASVGAGPTPDTEPPFRPAAPPDSGDWVSDNRPPDAGGSDKITSVPTQPPVGVVPSGGTAHAVGVGPINAPTRQDAFAATEDQYGLPSGYLAKTANLESRFNPRAYNELSGAKGMFQFIDSTARQYGLKNPWNAAASTDAAGRLARDNAAEMGRILHRDPSSFSADELYLAHQQGAHGAAAMLAHPDARAADIVGARAVTANGGRADMTAAQFRALQDSRFGGGSDRVRMAALSSPTNDAGPVGVAPPPATHTAGDVSISAPQAHGVAPGGIDWSSGSKLWPAIAAAGFRMAASRSPYFGIAAGEGGQEGMRTYAEEKHEEQAGGFSQQKINLEAAKLKQEADIAHQRLAIETKPYSEMTMAQKAEAENKRAEIEATKSYRQNLIDRENSVYLGPSGDGKGSVFLDRKTGQTTIRPIQIGPRPVGGANLSTAQQLMEERERERAADSSLPEMTFEEALALAHRAPNADQNTIRRLNLAASDWKSWTSNPENMGKKNAPEASLDYWEKRYGVSPMAPAAGGQHPAATPAAPAVAAAAPAGGQIAAKPKRKYFQGKWYIAGPNGESVVDPKQNP